MEIILETERLRIRTIDESDAPFIFTLLNSPGWLEFIGDRNIRSLEDARLYIINVPQFLHLKFGFGLYLAELKETATSIGVCSLLKRDTLEDVDIGFAFLAEYGGKGYAYEASSAMLDYAKNKLGIYKLVAITNTTNTSSVNLLKKLGLKFEKTIQFPGEKEELLYFST